MDNYKLTFFNLRGIAEPIRLIFKFIDVPFEDNQIDFKTWPSVKQDYKWQQVPYLEYNGKILTQSMAICRFLGRKYNLISDDPWEDSKCDEIMHAVDDLRECLKPMVVATFEGNVERAAGLRKEFKNPKGVVHLYLRNITDILRELLKPDNGNFILGKSPVVADFWLAHFTNQWSLLLEDANLLEGYELLKKQKEALYNLPGVKEWLAVRPQTYV